MYARPGSASRRSTPRTRGSSDALASGPAHLVVGPAHAGIFRRWPPIPGAPSGRPCARGDPPRTPWPFPSHLQSTPRAGILLRLRSAQAMGEGRRRVRGDPPGCSPTASSGRTSAPRPRGSSERNEADGRRGNVGPAPRPCCTCSLALQPTPHARGSSAHGPRFADSITDTLTPRARGSSPRHPRPRPRRRIDPALAGMLGCGWLRPVASSSRPRACGILLGQCSGRAVIASEPYTDGRSSVSPGGVPGLRCPYGGESRAAILVPISVADRKATEGKPADQLV